MPPKPKITREELLMHALEIAEEQGIGAVTSRSVAKAAGCSIQPVFSHFATMEELRQATFDYACDRSIKEILIYEKRPDFFPQIAKWVLDLARNRPNLFHLIYLSSGFQGNSLIDVMMDFESNKIITAQMVTLYGLNLQTCKDILMRTFLLLLGVSTMICENHMDLSDEQAVSMMKQTVNDMVQGAKRNGGTK